MWAVPVAEAQDQMGMVERQAKVPPKAVLPLEVIPAQAAGLMVVRVVLTAEEAGEEHIRAEALPQRQDRAGQV